LISCILIFLKKSNFNVNLKSVLTIERVEKDVVGDAKTSKKIFLGFCCFFLLCFGFLFFYKNGVKK